MSGEIVLADSRGVRISRPREWRGPVLRVMAALLAVSAPVQLAAGVHAAHEWAHILPPAVVFVTALIAAAVPRLSDRLRVTLLCLPLFGSGAFDVYWVGATPFTVLVFTQVTVVLGLVLGTRAGVAALLVTAACLAGIGAAGRVTGVEPSGWVRIGLTYAIAAGVLLAAVTTAVRRVEQALEDVRQALAQTERVRGEREDARRRLVAADERLQLILQAASVVTWSLLAKDRRFIWGKSRGPVAEGAFKKAPATLPELLALVPEADRARVGHAFEDALEKRAPLLELEHALTADDGSLRWYDVCGRLVTIDGQDVLVGVAVDATSRRQSDERRAEAQARLLRLSTSDTLARGDLSAAMREITEVGVLLLDVDRCGVWLYAADGEALEGLDLYHRRAGHDRGPRLELDAYPAYFAALRAQRTVAVHDAHADLRTRELGAYLAATGVGALLDSPIHVRGRLVGVLCHEHVGDPPRRWSPDDELAAGSLADFASRVVEASERALAERQLHVAYEQLGQLTRRMEVVREDERRTIARELHDELGQTLTAIKLNLALAARAPEDGERLVETSAIVDRALRSTRELSRAMRPPLLDEMGLVPALQAFLDEQGRYADVTFRLDAQISRRPSTEIEIAAFRVVQEAVTNVLRHASARNVRVLVKTIEDRLLISVTDDGVGFDVEAGIARAVAGGHLGLVGMRERARGLAGTFGVKSKAGAGTEIRVELPMGSRAAGTRGDAA